MSASELDTRLGKVLYNFLWNISSIFSKNYFFCFCSPLNITPSNSGVFSLNLYILAFVTYTHTKQTVAQLLMKLNYLIPKNLLLKRKIKNQRDVLVV